MFTKRYVNDENNFGVFAHHFVPCDTTTPILEYVSKDSKVQVEVVVVGILGRREWMRWRDWKVM